MFIVVSINSTIVLSSPGLNGKTFKKKKITGSPSSSSSYSDRRLQDDPYTHTRRSDSVPETDGALKTVTRVKILHYRQIDLNRPDPIAFMTMTVDTSGHIYDD